MNSQRAVSASKNSNTRRTELSLGTHAQPSHGILHIGRLPAALYALCCYFWTHSPSAECSFNYFLPYGLVQLSVLPLTFPLYNGFGKLLPVWSILG